MNRNHQSELRKVKRASMIERGNTWTARVFKAVRTGQEVEEVTFRMQPPPLTRMEDPS